MILFLIDINQHLRMETESFSDIAARNLFKAIKGISKANPSLYLYNYYNAISHFLTCYKIGTDHDVVIKEIVSHSNIDRQIIKEKFYHYYGKVIFYKI